MRLFPQRFEPLSAFTTRTPFSPVNLVSICFCSFFKLTTLSNENFLSLLLQFRVVVFACLFLEHVHPRSLLVHSWSSGGGVAAESDAHTLQEHVHPLPQR